MYYTFTPAGIPILCGGTHNAPISIHFNDSQQLVPLRHLSSYFPHKTLGVQKSPSGGSRSSYLAIRSKNDIHAKLIACSPLDRVNAWTYYHSIYLPSITYPFPSTTLTYSQCEQLQRQIKQAVLPKHGFNRHTPNAVVYGPTTYAGIGLRPLYLEQGLSQIESLIKCLRSTGPAQKAGNNCCVLGTTFGWHQLLDIRKCPHHTSSPSPYDLASCDSYPPTTHESNHYFVHNTCFTDST